MKILNNVRFLWSVLFVIIITNIAGYGYYVVKNYTPIQPEDPNFPTPKLIITENPVIGDIIDLSILPYAKEKPNGLQEIIVDWKVFDKNDLVKLRKNSENNSMYFPAGVIEKTYEVLAAVSYHYLFKDDKGESHVIKNYILRQMVSLNNAPLPPPSPDELTCVLKSDKISIDKGQFANLSWSSTGGTTAFINGQVVDLKGTKVISPDKTSTYILSVFGKNNAQPVTSQVVINVNSIPIPTVSKLRVLFVADKEQLSALPIEQQQMLNFPKELRTYLNSHCGVGVDGKQPEWRLFDVSNDLSNETEAWKVGMAKTKGKQMPYIIIANETSSFDGPLPKTMPELLTLLQKYGGQ